MKRIERDALKNYLDQPISTEGHPLDQDAAKRSAVREGLNFTLNVFDGSITAFSSMLGFIGQGTYETVELGTLVSRRLVNLVTEGSSLLDKFPQDGDVLNLSIWDRLLISTHM